MGRESYLSDGVYTFPINSLPLSGAEAGTISNAQPSYTVLPIPNPDKFLTTNVQTLPTNDPRPSISGTESAQTHSTIAYIPAYDVHTNDFLDPNVLTFPVGGGQTQPVGATNVANHFQVTAVPGETPSFNDNKPSPPSPALEILSQEKPPFAFSSPVNPAALQATGNEGQTYPDSVYEVNGVSPNQFAKSEGPSTNDDNQSHQNSTEMDEIGGYQGADGTLLSTSILADGETSIFQVSGQIADPTSDDHKAGATASRSSTQQSIVYTTLSLGHEVYVTSAPSSSAKDFSEESAGDDNLSLSTISGQEMVFTAPSKAPKLSSATTMRTMLAGNDEVTLSDMTASATTPSRSVEPTNFGSFTESDVPLTFVKTPVNYFYGVYFPVLLAVLYQMLVGYLYTTTKMMEPFTMLSKSNSISAKDFLWINYLSANDTFEPFAAMASGHWLMLCVAILYTAAQILSPLSSEMIGIYPGYYKINEDTAIGGACELSFSLPEVLSDHSTALWVHPQIARFMEAILSLVGLLLVALWYLLRRSQSHIHSDPSSIASIACLVQHPETSRLFRELDQTMPKDEIMERLAGSRWRLGWYLASDKTECYGIIGSNTMNEVSNKSSDKSRNSSPHSTTPETSLLASAPYRKKLRTQLALNTLLFLLTIGLFGVILAYQMNSTNNGFERFMDAQTFGPRFLFTSVGILLNSQWTRLERRSVVFEPFAEAHKNTHKDGRASAESTVHASRPLIPVTTLATSLWRRNFIPALLAFTALLGEALTIVLPGIPYDANQEYLASNISRYIALGILSFMLLVMVGYWTGKVMRWSSSMKLPKDPNTLGAMMMYVAGTRMAQQLAERAASRDQGDLSGGPGGSAGRKLKLRKSRREDGRVKVVIDFENGNDGDA